MKKLLIFIIVLFLVVIGGGYFAVFGAKPKDLGIRVTPEDSQKAREITGTEIISIMPGDNKKDFTLEGKKPIEFVMDSKELTAFSNNRSWRNYPVKNLQIKINPDGSLESSATLIIAKAMPYAMALGYSEAQIKDAMEKYNIPPVEVPIYIKGKGSVLNNKVSVNASNVTIGMVPIPGNIVARANQEAEQVLDDLIQKHSHAFNAEKVDFENGKLNFKGEVPMKEYVITE